MKNFLTTLWTDDSGQDMAEYALLLVLIAVVVAVAVIALRNAITDGFNPGHDSARAGTADCGDGGTG
jgi:pilus assembly protein Flp/PilA